MPQGKSYIAEIYTDGDKSVKTRTRVRCQRYLVNAQSVLRFSLRASGGAAIRLVLDTGDNRNVRTIGSRNYKDLIFKIQYDEM